MSLNNNCRPVDELERPHHSDHTKKLLRFSLNLALNLREESKIKVR